MLNDKVVLSVIIDGTNVMGNPLLTAQGVAFINKKPREIKVQTPITSITDFIKAFEDLFKKE